MSRIELSGVSKSFVSNGQVVEAIADVDLTVEKGEFVTVVGPSGCGKSSLLNLIAGLSMPTRGAVSYGGEPVRDVNTRVGYMTQDDNLLPWKTAGENIGLPRALAKNRLPPAARRQLIAEFVAKVGLDGFEDHFPGELSGGMRKRVALARMLIYEPETLLMDEPFAALDAQLRLDMQAELLRLWEDTGKTIVFITHDLNEAILLGTRILVMSARPGRMQKQIAVDFPRPRNVYEFQFRKEFADIYRDIYHLMRK